MSEFDRFRPSAAESIPEPGDEFARFRPQKSEAPSNSFDITPPPGIDQAGIDMKLKMLDEGKAKGYNTDNILRTMAAEGWKVNRGRTLAPVASPVESSPRPFSMEGAVSGEESPEPFREAIAAAARSSVGQPFVKQFYTGAGSFLKGGGALTKGVTDVAEYVGKPLGIPRSEIFDKAAQMWLDKGEELHQLAQEKGADFVDKMVGSAVGGGVPGVAEFMLNVPYYSFKGAIEAAKSGDSEAWGAITGGAKRYALGKTLHAAGTLTKPLAIPATGAVMGVQTAAEGGTPEETAEAVGTGLIFGATGAPGRTGARDIGRTIREGIDRLVRSKKPMTVETPPVMTATPPAPPLPTPITSEAIPTPPPAPETPVPPSVAPGTPEFYKAEADRLGVQFRGITETGLPSRPQVVMFQDGDNKTGAGGFALNPGETVEQALARARARYETPQPAAEAGPVVAPELPPVPAPVEKRAEERPVRSGYPESQVPDLPTVESDIAAVKTSLGRMEEDYAIKKEKDPSSMDTLAFSDRIKAYRESLGKLETRKADLVNLPKTPESEKLSTEIPQAETPGDKFANVRDIKSKKKSTMDQTPIARVRKAGGIKWADAISGEIRTYANRKEGGNKATALQMLFRRPDKNPKGYAKAMGWDQWVDAFVEDGTLPAGAGVTDLFDLLLENKPGKGAGKDQVLPDDQYAQDFAKSAEKAARETVPENEIALGDTFRIDGEKFKAVRYDEDGRLIIKDGMEYRLSPDDDIRVDGGKEGITPGEIPKGKEAVGDFTVKPTTSTEKEDAGWWDIEDKDGNLVDMTPTREEAIQRAKDEPAIKAEVEAKFKKRQQDLIKDKSFKLAEEPVPEGPAGEFKPPAAGEQDELFPGERAKYRAPEKGPPAPPPEGGLFAKGEEGFAPEKDFRTKPAEPVDEGVPMSRSAIADFLSKKFDIPLRVGRFRSALGIFKVGPEVIRTRFAHDIEVIAHEIGHALHKYLWPGARTGSGGLAAGPLRQFQDELIPIATKPRAGGSKNAEGFAEFIRLYVVNPEEAKRVAPKFFAFFEKELDAKSPDSKAILLKVRADYKRWLEQPALARVMGSINQTPKTGAALSFKKLYANTIDALYPLEEITKEMAGVKRIDEVPANKNPYKLAHLLAGWKGKADAWLEYKVFSFKTYRFSESVKPFRKIMEPIKKNRDIFDAYLVSKRSVQLGETKTGILDADARKVIEDMERDHPEFKQAAIELKHYQNALLRYLYDGGIINGEQFLRMRQANEDYVPFYRVMDYERTGGVEGGASHEVKGAPVYRFKGSWRDIVSPTESIIKNTYAFINAAEKNAVGKALVELSRSKEGLGKFVEKIPADTQRIAVKDTELEDMLRKYGKWTETTQFQTTERVIRESIKDETGADIPAGDRGTRIMKERAVEALKTRGYSQAEADQIVSRIASAKNETARNRIIERVTERATVRNTVREFGIDIPEGLAYIYRKSPNTPKGNVITVMERGKPTYYEVDERIYNAFHALDKEGANTLIRILAVPSRLLRVGATLTPEFALGKNPIRDQWTAFINSKYGYIPGVDLARGLFTAVKKNEDYWRWKVGGGEHSAMVSMDREYFDKTWKEIMRDRGVKAEAIHLAEHPIDVLRALSEYTEEATRLGEFRKGLKKEKAPEGPPGKVAIQEAAYASREVTLPFARMGAKTKAVNMIVAFWNANMQDLDKIHRQFKEYPVQTSIRTMAAITLPSVLLAIANHGNKKIDEIAQWQKDIFWLVDVGPFVMRIPKPFIMGIAFGSFPERIVNYILDKDPRAFDGLLESLSRGSMPGWMPTFANPIVENWANKSRFTDRSIVPKNREDVLPQYQYAPYTTETAKKIGGLLAKIPGMKGSDLENLIVSPAKLENMIRGYTGGLGMWALNAANASLKTAGIVPSRVEPSKQLADYPLIKAFVVRYPTADTESIQRFFSDYKKAETNLKSSKLLMKQADVSGAKEILTKEEVARLVVVKTALTNAHRIVELIYENPKITPEEKRRLIDQTYMNMTAIAREGNKALDGYKEAKKAAVK